MSFDDAHDSVGQQKDCGPYAKALTEDQRMPMRELIFPERASWLSLIQTRSFQEALSRFSEGVLEQYEQACDAQLILEFASFCLERNELPTAIIVLRRIQSLELKELDTSRRADALLLLALASAGIDEDYREQLFSVRRTTFNRPDISNATQRLACEALCQCVWRELSTGSNRIAALTLLALRRLCKQHRHGMTRSYSVQTSVIRALTRRHVMAWGYSCKVRAGAKLKDSHASAVDTVRVYGDGHIIVIIGWYVSREPGGFELFLCNGHKAHRVKPELIQRTSRQDLRSVENNYGIDGTVGSGFNATFFLRGSSPSPWRDAMTCTLLISDQNGNLSVHTVSIDHRPLDSVVIRNAINLLITPETSLVDYAGALVVRDTWNRHIKQASANAEAHMVFGRQNDKPELSIVVPIYGRIDFIEFQLNWFHAYLLNRGQDAVSIQLIYVLDDPIQRAAVMQLCMKCSELYQIPFELVTTQVNLGFAGANNLGCQYARSSTLLLMNSDVLPADYHAIEQLLSEFRSLGAEIGALGARLLYPSGDIQHLGMEFHQNTSLPGILGRTWLNDHPGKFIHHSSSCLPQTGTVTVEAATAACVMLSKALFKELGGFQLYYVTGDFEDSDLCLRIRERGLRIAVHVDATFYHLERQSMALHADQDANGIKVVAFNAQTHHTLNCAAIARLKQSNGRAKVDMPKIN